MPKSDFIPAGNNDFVAWHDRYLAAIQLLGGPALGMTAPEVGDVVTDNATLHTAKGASDTADAGAKQATQDWVAARRAVEGNARSRSKAIKGRTDYTPGRGAQLGIEGPEQTGPDLTTIQPVITATISGNRVEVGWGWQGYAAFLNLCEIQVDRGDGHGYGLLAYDTTPGYVDTQPFPATPTKWTYRAIYRVGDGRVGQWSQNAAITVG